VTPVRRGLALASILGVAAAMRLPVLAERELVEGDGVHYASLARKAMAGDLSGFANPYWSNLWPALIAGTNWLTGLDVVESGRLASLLLGIALCATTGALGVRLFGPVEGVLAGFVAAVHPWLVTFSTLVFTESCFTFLVVAVLLATNAAARHPVPWRAALVGAIAGVALWTRPEAFAVTIVAAAVVAHAASRRTHVRNALACGAALLLVASAFLAARAAVVHHYSGEWDFGIRYKGTANLFVGMAASDVARERFIHGLTSGGETRLEATLRRWSLVGFAREHPRLLVEHVGRNLARLADETRRVLPPVPVAMGREAFLGRSASTAIDLAAFACLGLALLGLVQGLRARETRLGATLCGALWGVQTLGLAPLVVHDRMLVPTTPIFILLLAHGLALLVGRLADARWAVPVAAGVALSALAGLSLYGLLRAPSLDYASEPVAQKQAGLWLRERFPQATRLMTLSPSIAFYFYDAAHQQQEVDLPWATLPVLLKHARGREVDVVAAPEWQLRAAGVPAAPDLVPRGSHPGFDYLATVGEPPYSVHIFCMTGAEPRLDACADGETVR
jgi:hypothetical protein